MPMYLPMVIAVALNASPIAENIPQLDVAGECRAEVSGQDAIKSCIEEESRWRQQLEQEWSTFNATDRRQCGQEAAMGGATSYAEFLTCLEMARDTRNAQEPESQPAPKARK
jgi:hypothetical protein